MKIKILLFCYLSSKEYILLYHFLKHYKKLGVNEFHLTIDCHNDENLKEKAIEVTKNYNTFNTFVNEYTSEIKQNLINRFIKEKAGDYNWIVYVDLDEFINLKESKINSCNNLIDLANSLNSEDIKSIRGYMCDKVNPSNIETPLDFNTEISDSFSHYYPVSSIFVKKGTSSLRKNPFFRGNSFSFLGSHTSDDFENYYNSNYKANNNFLILDHYKWHKQTIEKLKHRFEVYGKSYVWKDKHHDCGEYKINLYKNHLKSFEEIIKNGYETQLLCNKPKIYY